MSISFILLFLFCFGATGFMIQRLGFVRKSGLSQQEIWGLYAVRVFCGCFLGCISLRYYPSNDYWNLLKESQAETTLLKSDPIRFFTSLFDSPYENAYGQFFNAVGSYWNDLRNNLIQKCLAIINLISGGDYYVNSIFFNAFGFLGHVAFYRFFTNIFSDHKRWIFWGTFFIPSTLYFSSGIHKDLVVFSLFGFLLWALHQWLDGTRRWKYGWVALISLLGLILMRNYLLLILIPAFAGYVIALRRRISIWMTYGIMVGLMFVGLLVIESMNSDRTPLKLIQQRQQDFMALKKSNSDMEFTPLKPTLQTFIKQAPEAMGHAFFRPYPTESKHVFSLALSIELFLFWFLLIFSIATAEGRQIWKQMPVLGMLLFTALALWILFGFICPNYHTLARYRSLYLILLVPPLLVGIAKGREQKQIH